MKKYIPNNTLIKTWIDSKKFEPYPLMAIFEFDNKKLIYIGTEHNTSKSFDAIDYGFVNFDIDCVVTEIEHTCTNIEDKSNNNMNELAYSAYIAQIKNIPYIFADTNFVDWLQTLNKVSYDKSIIIQTMWILNNALKHKKYFNKKETIQNAFENLKYYLSAIGYNMTFTTEEFKKCVKEDFGYIVSDENISDILENFENWNEPNINGYITNQIWADINFYSRNPYMLKEIFRAINQYNNVLVTMGAGHYEEQRLVLEKAFGAPKYIHKFPKTKSTEIK